MKVVFKKSSIDIFGYLLLELRIKSDDSLKLKFVG
jgi:hypothetical protein